MFLYLLTLLAFPDTIEFTNFRINSDSVDNFHNEEQIVVNPTDSANLVACWRDFRLGYRQIGIGYSFDGGLTWDDYLIPSEYTPFWQDSDPGLTTDAEGNIYLVILSLISTSDSNALVVLRSSDGGLTFDPSTIAVISGGTPFEDKELIACDRTTSEHRGNLYIAWARFGRTNVHIYSVTSLDGNQTWEIPTRVSDQGGVQWPVPCVGKDGTYYVAWMRTDPPYGIKLDISSDGGITWGSDINVVSTTRGQWYPGIDGYYLTFSFPAIDADITDGPHSGNLYIAYMDQGSNGTDIFFTRSIDGGETWSPSMRISGDDQPGNDQFHQWLCVDNTGVIHVIFYDQRNGIADNLLDIYYVYSEDGGEAWSEPIRVTDVSSRYKFGPTAFPAPSPMPAGPIGEYIGLAAHNGTPFPVWTDFREDGMQRIYFGWKVRDTIPEAVAEPPAEISQSLSASFDGDLLNVRLAPYEQGIHHYTLYDAAGMSAVSICNTSNDFSWDVGALPRGVYFLHVRGNALDESVKVVKLR